MNYERVDESFSPPHGSYFDEGRKRKGHGMLKLRLDQTEIRKGGRKGMLSVRMRKGERERGKERVGGDSSSFFFF